MALTLNPNNVHMYTDGSCKNNPGPAGWGLYVQFPDGGEERLCGPAGMRSTNNRGELMAMIEALRKIEFLESSGYLDDRQVDVYTDSTYVKNGLLEWGPGWARTAFRRVKNSDLWEVAYPLFLSIRHTMNIYWVKGHAGTPGNVIADELANQGVLMNV